MAYAILGILLGLNISGVVALWHILDARTTELSGLLQKVADRIVLLERKKVFQVPEPIIGATTEPAKVAKARPISWSQARDAAEAGEAN